MRSLPESLLAAIPIAALTACSSGPGRAPDRFDAEPIRDAPTYDAVLSDAEPLDGGMLQEPDAMARGSTAFTGMFGILGASDTLFAREVNGHLNLEVGVFPYEYIGTIANDGTVRVTSPELTASGCAIARISGSYDRESAYYVFLHETCNAQGMPVSSMIRGGFFADFDRGQSGIYELRATVRSNPAQCYMGPQSNVLVRYAFSFLPNRAMAVFTAEDLISTPAHYEGEASPGGMFSAIQRLSASSSAQQVSMMGSFQQLTARDPVRFSGIRDVWDPVKRCGFTITLNGMRTSEL